MTDNIERTIAALRQHATATALSCQKLQAADILALCDAAERGLRCPPREPTQRMSGAGTIVFMREQQKMIPKWTPEIANRFWRAMYDAAPINEGGQEAKGGGAGNREEAAPDDPVPPSPAAPAPTLDPRYCHHAWEYRQRYVGCVLHCGKPQPPRAAPAPSDAVRVCPVKDIVCSTPDECGQRETGCKMMIRVPDAAPAPDALQTCACGEFYGRGLHAPDCPVRMMVEAQAAQIARLTAELAERTRERDEAHGAAQACELRAERAEAECKRLLGALRRHTIGDHMCHQCDTYWNDWDKEQHAPGCLAARGEGEK